MQCYSGPPSLLEIRLDQLRWNYLALQKRLKKGADCAAVVKSDAYGLGAISIVQELYKANCRHFYVAYADEGVVVRRALGFQEAQVYVLHGPNGAVPEDFAESSLTPVLNTPGDIEFWSSFAKKHGVKMPAVVHIDTGMNRLGLSAKEAEHLKNNPDILKPLDVRYVMSHLACADEPAHPKNAGQLMRFKDFAGQLGLPCRLSLANSAGIFLGEDYHFDQARPGCAIYGINPQPANQNPMQNVVILKSRILQIREAGKGETVGYGATYPVASPAKLAIVSVGYADGILRSLAGNGTFFINGQKCPLAGRVSMNTVAVNVTGVSCAAGDWAEIIGAHQTVDDIAAEAGTIGYEILTGLGGKYSRIYSGQG